MKTENGVEKPLAEWTLKEVKKCCSHYTCNECQIRDTVCGKKPSYWDIKEKKKFTEQEIKDAKTLNRLLNRALDSIYRNDDGAVFAVYDCIGCVCGYLRLSNDSFQSIKEGCSHTFLEIIGDSDA